MEKDLGQTLRELRNRFGYMQTEVAQLLQERGCPCLKSSVSRWELGRTKPSVEQFVALCEIYHVSDVAATFRFGRMPSIDDALNEEGRKKVAEYRELLISSGRYAPQETSVMFPASTRRAPFFENVASAGPGAFLDGEAYELIEVGPEVPASANFGLRICGDSMEPACRDGDSIWVHQQPVLEDGDLGLFIYNGQSYMKQFSKSAAGVRLVSLNPAYKPMLCTEGDELIIMGKVVAITPPSGR